MHRIPVAIAIIALVSVAALGAMRCLDAIQTGRTWHSVAEHARNDDPFIRFDPAMVADLPEPARRYFGFTLSEGAILPKGAKLSMTGTLTLGSRSKPVSMTMEGQQIMVPPHGFVWALTAGSGRWPVTGADALVEGASWSRFWTAGLLPVGRAGGSDDHWRAAFGRMVAETAFWSPASLLPRNGVVWTAIDATTARATVTYRGVSQSVDIFIREDGAPVRVEIDRWSDANEDGVFRFQRFGGYLQNFRTIDGITVPMRVEGGNFIGTPDYLPFYQIQVTAFGFPGNADDMD